ncbi:uncharacterized protein LOC119069992 [Bradysia coprophila]|uniref:uncharacterized protein LOC119069992 n=1 Tax=Bradysia coprophila TaxID=38358 RepID=UPI00187DC474|nr:uncharacterized protein LOC119069992 [Bradysia coprophila]
MIVNYDKSFKVGDIQINDDYAMVRCKIPNYKDIRRYVQIGESITTKDHFDLDFKGCRSKWKMIFYPNGQYDFGNPSNDCRLYLMLTSCEKTVLKMNIQAYMTKKSLRSQTDITVSSNASESVFVASDKLRNWAGPLILSQNNEINKESEMLFIRCTFRLLSYDNKRGLNEAGSTFTISPLKKSRSMSPAVVKDKIVGKHDCSPMEVDFQSSSNQTTTKPTSSTEISVEFLSPPNPFESKSPILCNRLMQPLRPPRENPAESFVNCQRGNFKHRRPSSRTIIFDPNEREKARQWLNPNDNVRKSKSPLTPSKNSECLKTSDINVAKKADPEMAQSGTEERSETSTSDSDMLPGDDESNDQRTLREKIHHFENSFK